MVYIQSIVQRDSMDYKKLVRVTDGYDPFTAEPESEKEESRIGKALRKAGIGSTREGFKMVSMAQLCDVMESLEYHHDGMANKDDMLAFENSRNGFICYMPLYDFVEGKVQLSNFYVE